MLRVLMAAPDAYCASSIAAVSCTAVSNDITALEIESTVGPSQSARWVPTLPGKVSGYR